MGRWGVAGAELIKVESSFMRLMLERAAMSLKFFGIFVTTFLTSFILRSIDLLEGKGDFLEKLV